MSSELDLLIEVLAKPYKYLGNLLPGDGTRTLAFQPDGREPFKVLTKIRDNGKSFAIHFDDDAGSAEVTGKGDAFRILSTVIQIAKDYVKKVKTIEEIWIIAKYEEGGKNSRAKLYKALIDKFAENEGFKLDKTEMHTSKGIEYMTYILKKNAVEEEVVTYKAFTNAVRTDETPNKDGYIETTASSDKEAVKNLKYKIAGLITTIQRERLKKQKDIKLKNLQKYADGKWGLVESLIQAMMEERSIAQLMKTTPRRFKLRAEDIKPTLLNITQAGKLIYKTVTESNHHVHRQYIKPLPNVKGLTTISQNVILHCNCENFTFENEYSLWKTNASHIVNSIMEPPLKTNPGMKKKVCKHLIAVFEDLKKRLS